jgi:hypothetical protein
MILKILNWIARHRKPLPRSRSTPLVVLIGLVFGAIGVGIYLRSFLDFVLCMALTSAAALVYAETQSFGALVLYVTGSALYGFHRVRASNEKRAANPAV